MTNGHSIKSAGILIIGDEVLNGKILDTNSHDFAKYCFNELAIPLKRTVVCGDDEEDIISSLDTLKNCDFIVTSGGIGSTHDDISYDSIAKYFTLKCEKDAEVVERMQSLRDSYLNKLSDTQLNAFYRMATIPQGQNVEKIFIDKELWVPIVGINHKVYILPGVPHLFSKLVRGLGDHIKSRISQNHLIRYFVKTTTGESEFAHYLATLQERCDSQFGKQAVKLGSYPHLLWKIQTISIIGDIKLVTNNQLREIVNEVVSNIGGNAKEIDAEEEDRLTTTTPK